MADGYTEKQLMHALNDSFGDYHAHGGDQARWLAELVRIVRSGERERCAKLAEAAGHAALAAKILRG